MEEGNEKSKKEKWNNDTERWDEEMIGVAFKDRKGEGGKWGEGGKEEKEKGSEEGYIRERGNTKMEQVTEQRGWEVVC